MPRWLVKHSAGCFCEGVLGEIYIETWAPSKADSPETAVCALPTHTAQHVLSQSALVGFGLLLEKQGHPQEQPPTSGADTHGRGQDPPEFCKRKLYNSASLSKAKNNLSQENIRRRCNQTDILFFLLISLKHSKNS